MRPAALPLGAAVMLLGYFLLFLVCGRAGAEVGGRHIRRITAADLPSSNNSDVTKTRLKKLHVRNIENCTSGTTGSCNNPPLTTVSPPLISKNISKGTSKNVPSFVADDVLQGRLHTDVRSHLTTTASPYDGGYDSYFDEIVTGSGGFGSGTVNIPKLSSFRDSYHPETEASNFEATLTTPRISIFDDFHARVTEGIRQNLEELDDHKYHERDSLHGDSVLQERRQRYDSVRKSEIPSSEKPAEKRNESVSLEFSSNFSLVYNDSRSPSSVRKDLVAENGTHIDFEKSYVHTELEPEVNMTISYILNDILPTVSPTTEEVKTLDLKKKVNGKYSTSNSKLSHTEGPLSDLTELSNVSEGMKNNSFQGNNSENVSVHLDTSASTNTLQTNTGSPGDKESTTSEPTWGRSYSRSLKPMNYSSNERNLITTEETSTRLPKNASSTAAVKKENAAKAELSNVNNNSITKDPSSNTVANVVVPHSSEKSSSRKTNDRGGRMLISTSNHNTTSNDLDGSSQIPLSGSSENSFINDGVTKKSRARYTLRRNNTNKNEVQMESSTTPQHTTEKTVSKTDLSAHVPEDNAVLSQTAVNTVVSGNKTAASEYQNGRRTDNSEEVKESSTLSNSINSRSRAYSYRRPFTTASTTSRNNESVTKTRTSSNIEVTTRSSASTSANIEAVKRRLSTVRQTSTDASVILFSSSNFTTESNTIVRGWPAIARRPSVITKLTSNRTLTLDKTDNNEGNDIISSKSDLYKSIIRNRGTVRYGIQRNDTSVSNSNMRNASTFSIPPTAAAWSLATLKGPRNETRFVRQPILEDNSTSSETNITQTKSTAGRWPPTRGRRPWNTQEEGTTTNSSDTGNAGVGVTPKSTKLIPVSNQKQVTRTRGSVPPKKVQQSSMQENRLSSILITTPSTDQYESTTEEPEMSTFRTYSEEWTGSPSSLVSSESEEVFTTSETSTEKSLYSTTEDTIPVTNITPEISTLSTSSVMLASDASSGSDLISESLVNSMTTEMASTSTELGTSTNESFESTTENVETTTEAVEKTTPFREVSTEDAIPTPVPASEESVITSTPGYMFQRVTTGSPITTVGSDGGYLEEEINNPLKRVENDQQENENQDGDSGNNSGVYHEVINNAGEMNNQGEEIKQVGINSDGIQEEGDSNRPLHGDDTRPDSGSSYNHGDPSGNSPEDEEIKNSDGNRHMDEDQATGEKLPARPSAGDDPLPVQEEPSDVGGPDLAAIDHTSASGVRIDETTTVQIQISSALPSSDGTQTRKSVPLGSEPSVTSRNEQTTTWSSSTSAIEWEVDSTTLPSASEVPFYLILTVSASWPVFCDKMQQFKKSVVNLMANNDRSISTNQVVLPNVDAVQCQKAESSMIEVEMYLVDGDNRFEPDLTSDFYRFWKISGLQDFPIQINTVEPVGQTPEASHDDEGGGGGMIAAITISCIGAVCLLLLAVLWLVMRKRQQRFNYGQRCTPVSLDAYSLDSVSVCGSVRRKGVMRNSKRSYGNAGFDDPGSPSHPMGFAGLANFILNRESLEEEFASIPQVTANVDELPEGADTKNRYSNVIPLPETRVPLSPIEGEPLSEYINANFVHGPKNASKYYIACQAPLTSTVNDFWRMIWEQQSKVILMLTDLVENGVEKSADYLPPSEVLDCHRLFGDFQITLKKREVKEKYVISTLQLKNLETNSWREVMHLWYVSWPAQGVPDDVSSVIAFLLEARPYMRGGPCVVHCSPGTGRTGTVLACDLCIRDFETARIVDIPRCIARLRRDRAGAVQTRDQYVFIYQVINLYGAKLTGGALDSM